MVFSSTVFLFLFLPAVWLLYLLIPKKAISARNVLLGIASLLFYAYGEPIYIVIMLFSVLFNYAAAIAIGKSEHRKRVLTVFAVAVNLFILGFFKYIPWLCSLLPFEVPLPALALPVGISFYTFQILSYVLDVSRGRVAVQNNYFTLLLYISFFPKLIAGPIVTYDDIKEQLSSREVTLSSTAYGIRRFILGLSKKLIISNTAAVIADAAFSAAAPSSAFAWAGAITYCLQIYFDFSGYSDMAIGLASMFGFSICENFNYPYSATTIRDFWKRWHISLTTWFREYVYIPLGGNRGSTARTIFNRIFVFFLTGIWHGANFTYIIWGLWHGALMMLERLLRFDLLEKKRPLRPLLRVYTLLCVALGFVVFRAPNITHALRFIGRMFTFGGSSADVSGFFSPYTVLVLALGVLLSAPLYASMQKKALACGKESLWNGFVSVLCIPLFVLCVMTLASSSFNPFIYYIF